MGPPVFTGGRATAPIWRPSERRLQWGRRSSPAEGRRDDFDLLISTLCFNGAAGLHRRRAGSAPRIRRLRTTGFNGAAGLHRRRGHTSTFTAAVYLKASMGPPVFTGGGWG